MTEIITGEAAETADRDTDLVPGMRDPRRIRVDSQLAERASRLLESAMRNEWGAQVRLAEAFSSSDFTMAAFAQIDTEIQAQYAELPSVWRQYTTVTTVNDFRPRRLLTKWRNTLGFARVPELTEYPAEDQRGHKEFSIAVAKYGRRFAISWEAWVNNEAIQELEDLPGELVRQADETETINALANILAIDPKTGRANGVNTDLFNGTNKNAPSALPLTLENLDATLSAMANKKSVISGRVVAAPPLLVLIPQALSIVAERIKAINLIRQTDGSGVTTEMGNYLSSVRFVVDPMLDNINDDSKANTTWFVLPVPGGQRPATYAAFLRGHETPDIRVRAATGTTVSGGAISPLEGSFELDDIQYRGRHVLGHQVGDPTFTFASLGQ